MQNIRESRKMYRKEAWQTKTPAEDGCHMPGEFEPHEGCILIWPYRPGSWGYGAKAAEAAFKNVISAIAQSERVYVAAGKACITSAKRELFGGDVCFLQEEGCYVKGTKRQEDPFCKVVLFEAETDDAWARDIAPTFVIKSGQLPAERQEECVVSRKRVRAVSWEFNAWGGRVDGLYASWERDNAFAAYFAEKFGYECYRANPFVLEGGSVHSDGEGTLMVTEACLLSPGRNPGLSKEEIEVRLKAYLGAEKVLWLPRGIYGDETNEHVDNIAAFIRPGEVVLAWTDRKEDPQYPLSVQCLSYLEGERDARGRRLKVHKLPIPDHPICVTEEEQKGYTFEEGEDKRETGERLAASYVNFYYANGSVIMPVFGGENEESDRRAAAILEKLNPDRKVICVFARDILSGGGNIHCITQQIPAESF